MRPSTQKQHVDFFRKLLLRRRLCSSAGPGAAYVPFVGDGDLAVELYKERPIYGADIDPKRVETARGRLPDARIVLADCNSWPFPDVDDRFALADFDAYVNPYPSLEAFWRGANKMDGLVLFGTDGFRQRIKRERVLKSLPSGAEVSAAESGEWRAWHNFWWTRHVRPWIEALIKPYLIVTGHVYLRGDQSYWGLVVKRER